MPDRLKQVATYYAIAVVASYAALWGTQQVQLTSLTHSQHALAALAWPATGALVLLSAAVEDAQTKVID